MKARVLSINTYGGSLLLGARSLGVDLIGSYEDAGYGSDVQAANFPDVPLVRQRKDWPEQDLSNVIVLAHPPCSAFSLMNNSPTARGINSSAFACTRSVLDYAMRNNAAAIAVESVMGALGGAWEIHQAYADEHDYHIYRILENGCMFGAQWRERFWALWVKKEIAPETLHIALKPRYQTVREVVTGFEDGPSAGSQDRQLERQKQKLIDEGLTPEDMSRLFDVQDPPHRTTSLANIIWETKFKKPDSDPWEKEDVRTKFVGDFGQGALCFIGPDHTCPVVLGGSFWYYNGRCLSENAFKRLMGFPADYVFPEGPKKNYRRDMRTYLSKGVMPPIAHWILEVTARHLGWDEDLNYQHELGSDTYLLEVEPNHLADFRISKTAWFERHTALPPLRGADTIDLKERKTRISLPRPERVKVPKIPRHVFEPSPREGDDANVCYQCGEPQEFSKHIRVKVPREKGVRDLTVRSGRLSAVRIDVGEIVITDVSSITMKKRCLIQQIVNEIGPVRHDTAIQKALEHQDLQILPTTMHWHIRQMVKAGHLREVGDVYVPKHVLESPEAGELASAWEKR